MITVGMNYEVKEGREVEFEAVFKKVLEIMERSPSHRQTNLFRNVLKRGSYLIHSEWSDRTAFEAFIASDQFKNIADWGRREILVSKPKHEVYGATQPLHDAPPAVAGRCPVPH